MSIRFNSLVWFSVVLIPCLAFAEVDQIDMPINTICNMQTGIELVEHAVDLSERNDTPNGLDVDSTDYLTQFKNFRPCKADQPFSKDEDVIAFFKPFVTLLDSYLDTDIADLPTEASLDNKVSDRVLTDKIINGDNVDGFISQERLVQLYINMTVAYYFGEVVPKDDFKAIKYISKVADYYQTTQPMSSPWLETIFIQTIQRKHRLLSTNNPIRLQLNGIGLTATRLYLLSQAGHFDTQAKLLEMKLLEVYWLPLSDNYERQHTAQFAQDYAAILADLKSLADKGSYLAINTLVKHYRALAKTDNSYQGQAEYWYSKEEALPKPDMSWH